MQLSGAESSVQRFSAISYLKLTTPVSPQKLTSTTLCPSVSHLLCDCEIKTTSKTYKNHFKMDIQMKNTQICRLCLESELENGSFLVEIFSSLINEPGKINLSEKIKALFGLKVRRIEKFRDSLI